MKHFSLKKALPCAAVILAAVAASALPSCTEEKKNEKVEPLFAPTLESMEEHFQTPQWYKDAKFGIFTHWGPQCQPESGDWYARNMYYRDHWHFNRHKEKYGDQKTFGFKDVIHEWKGEKWDPQELAQLFKSMGAKYVVSMANHHDRPRRPREECETLRLGEAREVDLREQRAHDHRARVRSEPQDIPLLRDRIREEVISFSQL